MSARIAGEAAPAARVPSVARTAGLGVTRRTLRTRAVRSVQLEASQRRPWPATARPAPPGALGAFPARAASRRPAKTVQPAALPRMQLPANARLVVQDVGQDRPAQPAARSVRPAQPASRQVPRRRLGASVAVLGTLAGLARRSAGHVPLGAGRARRVKAPVATASRVVGNLRPAAASASRVVPGTSKPTGKRSPRRTASPARRGASWQPLVLPAVSCVRRAPTLLSNRPRNAGLAAPARPALPWAPRASPFAPLAAWAASARRVPRLAATARQAASPFARE
mmetsp:Transcript_16711/g.39688  ORF Transcript_16711/g.39688 Transcript_16711/m.39688 type:complete len:282 (-) Transcript_16711:241-1086(-)